MKTWLITIWSEWIEEFLPGLQEERRSSPHAETLTLLKGTTRRSFTEKKSSANVKVALLK